MKCGHGRDGSVLADFCDGKRAEEHPLFSEVSALQIILYYDDLEICNPIGDARITHKLGNEYNNISRTPFTLPVK